MPDIKNAAEYADYERNVVAFIAREQIEFLSTGTDDGSDPEHENVDPWFSWLPCPMCGSYLGGMREYLFARSRVDDERVQFTICEDCVYYVAYGRLDDYTMQRIGE